MSEVLHLDHFRKRVQLHHPDPAVSRVIVAMQDMSEAEQKAFADRVVAVKPRVYKTPDREKRKEMWRKAEMLHRFYDGLVHLTFAAQHAFEDYGCQEAKPLAHYGQMEHWHLLVDKRSAVARQLFRHRYHRHHQSSGGNRRGAGNTCGPLRRPCPPGLP
jgi:hypothetical protein